MATFSVTAQGDTLPALRMQLPAGSLPPGAQVRFVMDGVLDAPAEIVATDPPEVQYIWRPEDAAIAPRAQPYRAGFRVIHTDGRRETIRLTQFGTPLVVSIGAPLEGPSG